MSSARRKTPASELAKAISQSKQSPSVYLQPPKPSHVVPTQEELGRMGVRGAPKQPDIKRTPQYKSAARRWTMTIVALPILLYTSYSLYQRVFNGKSPRGLPGVNEFSSQAVYSSAGNPKKSND
ncbi:hypothetical protein MGYG_08391 [Nannizzia gypsea CBS 118893]|uniref:Uncharacterized protein n=1 Tax=Arthroderma gypseum (strain ATCC MYA-4604 / CBS 118893) TaxID=535722 RepID=E4V5K5_ARTGP|nr:hypothetical protein MGYG_08391 [Nannizzia gypsea CBS 118893]EFR05380.1 hypothetical protein MGYG_08391 [Nannizzia gypsea CBS 118893]